MRGRLTRKYFASATFGASASVAFGLTFARADAYTMRLSTASFADSVNGRAALRFASAVQRRSNGRLKVEVYPNGTLASEQDTVDALKSGIIDLSVNASAVIVPSFPQYQVFDLPFFFKDADAAYRAILGPIGDELFGQLDAKGLVGLGWGYAGFKEFETTTKAVVDPEDMRGLRIRAAPSAVFAATYAALGAIPVTIDKAETFTALSAHTVDALDLPSSSFVQGKFYTVCKHVALSNHIFSCIPLIGSKRKIEALPSDLQKILKEEGRAVVSFWRSINTQQATDDLKFLRNNGVAFTDIHYAAFHRAMEPVYALVESKVGGNLIERISKAGHTS